MTEKPKITKQPHKDFWIPHILKALDSSIGGSAPKKEVTDKILSLFDISDDVYDEFRKDKISLIITNNIAFARKSLNFAGYIDKPKNGVWALTDKAKQEMPEILKLDKEGWKKFIKKIINLENEENKRRAKEQEDSKKVAINASIPQGEIWTTGNESADDNGKQIEEQDKEDEEDEENEEEDNDLAFIKSIKPEQFEALCGELFRKVGYEDVEVTRKSKDGGFDGVGYLVFGLVRCFKVAFQSKRYASTPISSEEMDKFFGTMNRIGAEKGVLITTSDFTRGAKEYAAETGIEIINGKDLISLLRKHNIGYIPKVVINKKFFKEL